MVVQHDNVSYANLQGPRVYKYMHVTINVYLELILSISCTIVVL